MEKFLSWSRLLLIIPVIGCVVLTLGSVIMGMGRIITDGIALVEKAKFSPKAAKMMTVSIVEIIDLFLFGTVAYIAAVGLYKLFVAGGEIKIPVKLKINNLADLERKIIGVIVAALAVAFLGQVAEDPERNPQLLLYYGGGIALVIAALGTFILLNSKSSEKPHDKS